MNKQRSTRVDTLELKAGIVKRIGHQRAEKYFNQLGRLLTSKVNRKDFGKYCVRILGKENVHLHNQFITAILKNAHVAEVPPLKGRCFTHQVNDRFSNGTRRNVLGPLNADVFPITNQNDMARDGSNPLEVLKAKEQQSATELLSLGSRPPVEVPSVEDGEEVEQRAASPSIQSRSPVTAPLGISVNVCGARKTLLNGSEKNYEHETCQNTGQLPDTVSLKKRLARSLEMEGVHISTDCVNLLNNSLDVYLKRLIDSCVEIAASRAANQHIRQRETLPLSGSFQTVYGRNIQASNRTSKNSRVHVHQFFGKLASPELEIDKHNARKTGVKLGTDNILMMSHESGAGNSNSGSSNSSWVPHPRTSIYVPKGHQSVMVGVPDGAATFSRQQTCWFKHVEGVDKAYPETTADHYLV